MFGKQAPTESDHFDFEPVHQKHQLQFVCEGFEHQRILEQVLYYIKFQDARQHSQTVSIPNKLIYDYGTTKIVIHDLLPGDQEICVKATLYGA